MAVLFSDNFNRTNSETVGNGWSEDQTSFCELEIFSNEFRARGTSAGNGAGRSILRTGSKHREIQITGKFRIDQAFPAGSEGATIMILGPNAGTPTFSSGFGMHLDIVNNQVRLKDNGVNDGSAAFTYVVGTQYNFELWVNYHYAVEIRIWATSGSRPGTPTLSVATQTPTASGDKWCIGFDQSSNTPVAVIAFDDYQVDDLAWEINKAEAVTLAENTEERLYPLLVSLAEGLSLVDAVTAHINTFAIYDSPHLYDDSLIQYDGRTATVESITISEALFLQLQLGLTAREIIGVTEMARAERIQYGWLVDMYTKETKPSGSYTKESKSSTVYTKEHKP